MTETTTSPPPAAPPACVQRLRLIACIEGVSFLVLLGVAMPLKYLAHMPRAVSICGSLHGGLFILFCLVLVHVLWAQRWPLWRGALIFASSLIPFGTFVIDPWLRRWGVADHQRGDGPRPRS